jgi:hypothetical protein
VGKRLVFWDFPRASWQYDLVVGLIVIFIFVTPHTLFHDQPRAASVILMGSNQVFITNEVLQNIAPEKRATVAAAVIHQRIGKNWHVTKVEPLRDTAEQEVKGFIAYTSQPN